MRQRKSEHRNHSRADEKPLSVDDMRSVLKREYLEQPPAKETEWTRIFAWRNTTVIESKFLVDGLEIPASTLKKRWPLLSLAEKHHFALAFTCKPTLTRQDHAILDFLMGAGGRSVWQNIALMLVRHPNRRRVLAFLAKRIKDVGARKANFYQALEVMNDRRALPALCAAYNRYSNAFVRSKRLVALEEYRDYLACSRAIWKIDGSMRHMNAIRDLLRSTDPAVRSLAEHYLGG